VCRAGILVTTINRGRLMNAPRGGWLSRRRIWMICREGLVCLVVQVRGRFSCRMKRLERRREDRVCRLMKI
jgi:hypothetical protein